MFRTWELRVRSGRLMNSDIGGNKVLSECEQGLMKHKLC